MKSILSKLISTYHFQPLARIDLCVNKYAEMVGEQTIVVELCTKYINVFQANMFVFICRKSKGILKLLKLQHTKTIPM